MRSLCDRDNFEGRVQFAASVILSGRETTRNFDNCFEMNDGDVVCEALRRRALSNPRMAAAMPKYLAAFALERAGEEYGHLQRRALPDAARQLREVAALEFDRFMAALRAKNAEAQP